MNNNETPRIYVACLAAYNAGLLHGKWIDANQDEEDIMEEIQTMLKASPEPFAEEWAIHDYENFGPVKLSEHESIEKVAELGQAMAEHGLAAAAYFDENKNLENFEDSLIGIFTSEIDFAHYWLEQSGHLKFLEESGLSYFFDFAAYARDLFLDELWSFKIDADQLCVFSH